MTDPVTTVATRNGAIPITQRARVAYDEKQIELIRATVAKDCSPAELHLFLEVAAKYDLDPFTHEIYAAKMGGKNGSSGQVVCIVGRDGLLQIANRSGEMRGLKGDVVHAKDEFTKAAAEVLPRHSYGIDRGPIVGAWAVAYREEREPTYFFAPLGEYMPTSEAKLKYSPWSSQVSAMILKCAESMALRKAFSITGVVAEEEMSRALGQQAAEVGETEWGFDPTLAAWIKALTGAINEARPNTYRDAKIRTKLRGRSDEEREVWAAQLAEEAALMGIDVPARPTLEQLDAERDAREAAEAAERGEIVQDAEVVDDVDDAAYVPSDPAGDIPFPGTEEAADGTEG